MMTPKEKLQMKKLVARVDEAETAFKLAASQFAEAVGHVETLAHVVAKLGERVHAVGDYQTILGIQLMNEKAKNEE